MRQNPSDRDKKFYLRLINFYEMGYTFERIGQELNVSAATVRNYINKLIKEGHDLELRGRGRRSDLNIKNKSKRIKNKQNKSSNSKLIELMNSQKRR